MTRRIAIASFVCMLACTSGPTLTPTPTPTATPAPAPATPPTEQPFDPPLAHLGCFLLLDLAAGITQVSEAQSGGVPTGPAATFKIPSALIGLETGVASGPDVVRHFDPQKHDYAQWGREDLTLTEAV